MNKQEMIEEVSKRTDITKSDVTKIIQTTLLVIENELKKKGKVVFANFGTFYTSSVKARTINSIDGSGKVKIPRHREARFKAGAGLKNAVR